MSSEEVETRMFDCINELILNDNDLIYLKNCLDSGRISNCSYVSTDGNQICESGGENERHLTVSSCWIRFINITNRFFQDFDKLVRCEYTNPSYASESYCSYLNGLVIEQPLINKFINVNYDISVVGYHLNILDIIKRFPVKNNYPRHTEEINSNIIHLNTLIYKIMTVGDKNYVAAIIDKHGVMYISKNLLIKLYETYSNKNEIIEFQRTVKNILMIFSEINTTVMKTSIDVLKHDLEYPIYNNIIRNIKLKGISTYVDQRVVNIFKTIDKSEIVLQKIKSKISSEIDNYLKNTCWGKNYYYSYKRIINDLLANQEDVKKIAAKKAFVDGLRIGNKFEMYGWSITDDAVGDGSSSSVYWEKVVNIAPDRWVHDGKYYRVKDKFKNDIPFHIEKIYLSSNGQLYARGNHPNVSGGRVCMGDLAGKIEVSDIENLGKNLKDLESLLYLINYDSSYNQNNRDWYKSHSQLIENGGLEVSGDFEPEGDNVCSEIVYIEDEDIEEV